MCVCVCVRARICPEWLGVYPSSCVFECANPSFLLHQSSDWGTSRPCSPAVYRPAPIWRAPRPGGPRLLPRARTLNQLRPGPKRNADPRSPSSHTQDAPGAVGQPAWVQPEKKESQRHGRVESANQPELQQLATWAEGPIWRPAGAGPKRRGEAWAVGRRGGA